MKQFFRKHRRLGARAVSLLLCGVMTLGCLNMAPLAFAAETGDTDMVVADMLPVNQNVGSTQSVTSGWSYAKFVETWNTEKQEHGESGHVCAYGDFSGFYAIVENTRATLVSGSDEMASLDAMLSESAAYVYSARINATLTADYTNIDTFDSAIEIVRYFAYGDGRLCLLDYVQEKDMAIVEAADELAAIARAGILGEEYVSESDKIIAEIMKAYEDLCANRDSMTLDAVKAETVRIQGLIDSLKPEHVTDIVTVIAEKLPEIISARAVVEFLRQIEIVQENAHAGKYDKTAEGFDREAARVEFAAIRNLVNDMTDEDAQSESVQNGLRILDNLDAIMDAPDDLSDEAKAFVSGVEALKTSVDNGEYDETQYALKSRVTELETMYTEIPVADIMRDEVIAAKGALENIKRRIVVAPEIEEFLNAVYTLMNAIGEGMDLESDEIAGLIGAVADAYDTLTEDQRENVEVQAAYGLLTMSGVISDSGVMAAETPYVITLRWAEDKIGDEGTLSADGTYANWNCATSSVLIATGLMLTVTGNGDVEDDFRIEIPTTLFEAALPEEIYNPTDAPILSDRLPMAQGIVDTDALISDAMGCGLSVTKSGSGTSGYTVLSFPGGIKGRAISIPLTITWRFVDGSIGSSRIAPEMPFFVGDAISNPVSIQNGGQIADQYSVTFTAALKEHIQNVTVSKYTTSNVTGKTQGRIRVWTSSLLTAYNLSEETFNQNVQDGYGYFDYVFNVKVQTEVPTALSYTVSPSNNGIVDAIYIGNSSSSRPIIGSSSDTWCWQVLNANSGAALWSRYYNDGRSLTGQSIWYGLMDAVNRNGIYYSSSHINGLYVHALVRYKLDDIKVDDYPGAKESMTVADCTLDVTAGSIYTGETVQNSYTIQCVTPYTKEISEGDTYGLSVSMSYSISSAPSMLTALYLGADNITCLYPGAVGTYKMPGGATSTDAVLALDTFVMFDAYDREYKVLGPGDYEINSLSITIGSGNAYFDEDGKFYGLVQDEALLSDKVQVYVTTWDSPDEWVYDTEISVKNFLYNSDSPTSTRNLALQHDHVLGVSFRYEDRTSFVVMRTYSTVALNGSGPVVQEVVRNAYENNVASSVSIRAYGGLTDIVDGKSNINNLDTQISSDMRSIITARDEALWSWANFEEAGHPLRMSAAYSRGENPLGSIVYHQSTTTDTNGNVVRNPDDALSNVQQVDYWLGSGLGLTVGGGRFPSVPVDGPVTYNHVRFYITVPANTDVVSVKPGGYTKNAMYATINNGSMSTTTIDFSSADKLPVISYHMEDDILVVDSVWDYDRSSTLAGTTPMLSFANFTVTICPSHTNTFTSTADTQLRFCGVVLDHDGNVYENSVIWPFTVPNQALFGGVLDNAAICPWSGTLSVPIRDGAYVSGLQTSVMGDDARFMATGWANVATIIPTGAYSYRLSYSQMLETSKNVVLFDSIEDVAGSMWNGYFVGVDMLSARKQGLDYKIYGNVKQIDSEAYIRDNISGSDLAAGYDGWVLLQDSTLEDIKGLNMSAYCSYFYDICHYDNNTQYQSIAIDFGDQLFGLGEDCKTDAVQIKLLFEGADDWTTDLDSNADNITMNRAFFCDIPSSQNQVRSAMANTVTVKLNLDVKTHSSKSFGALEQEDSGDLLALNEFDAITVGQDDGTDAVSTWGSVDLMDSESFIDDIVPMSDTTSDGWIVTQDSHMMTIEKEGNPTDTLTYDYVLRYAMSDPGTDVGYTNTGVQHVVIYDEIENGSESRFAGKLTGLSITGMEFKFAGTYTYETEFGNMFQPGTTGAARIQLIKKDSMNVWVNPAFITADQCIIYVAGPDIQASSNIENAVIASTGRSDWMRVAPSDIAQVCAANEIAAVAVYYPWLTTAHLAGESYNEAFLQVTLHMDHASKAHYINSETTIKNGFKVSYTPYGRTDPIEEDYPDQTTIEVLYQGPGYRLPVTGGPGTAMFVWTGVSVLALGAVLAIARKKKSQSV